MPVHGMIARADVLDWLEAAARNLLSFVSDKVAAVTTAGWVLIVFAALVLLWAWAIMHVSTRLGPITVDDLKIDGSADTPVIALTAAFRRRLSRVGLVPPPAVPEGTPQANIIQAVEATGTQGAAIGKLLELLPTPPKPPEFKVTAVLTGSESRSADGTVACGVSYTVLPMAGGAPYLKAVDGYSTFATALDRAADEIYAYIADSLPEVFPPWVRWRTPEALVDYLGGCDWQTDGDLPRAGERLQKATRASPFNALAALQLANLEERRAANAEPGWPKAYYRARAAVRYRAVAVLWPTIVEARYRGSVVSSALATTYENLYPSEQDAVEQILPIEVSRRRAKGAGYTVQLRYLADRESSATVQLLNRAYMLVRHRRLRNQFESKGRDRKALRKMARISRHCVRIRSINGSDGPLKFKWQVEERYRAAAVVLARGGLTWQARYNTVCFDALRLAGTGRLLSRDRAPGIERRALGNLDLAIRESAGELTRTWIENDPDMEAFRKGVGSAIGENPEWRRIVDLAWDAPEDEAGARSTRSEPRDDEAPADTRTPASGKRPPEASQAVLDRDLGEWGRERPRGLSLESPERPWGSAVARLTLGVGALLVSAIAGVVAVASGTVVADVVVGASVSAFAAATRSVFVAGVEKGVTPPSTAASENPSEGTPDADAGRTGSP